MQTRYPAITDPLVRGLFTSSTAKRGTGLSPMHLTRLLISECTVEKSCQVQIVEIGQDAMKLCKTSVGSTEPEELLQSPRCSHS